MPRTQRRNWHVPDGLSPELDGPPKPRMPVAFDLRQEPGADTEGAAKQKAARRDLRGGREVTPAPTATSVAGCTPSNYAVISRSRSITLMLACIRAVSLY